MSELNEHALDQLDGEQLLAYTTGTIRALELYELNNDAVQRLFVHITEVVGRQVARGRSTVVLQVEGENCFINQTLLRLDIKSFQRIGRLRNLLQRLDLNELEFREGVTPETLTVFFQRLTAASGDPEGLEVLADGQDVHVSIRKTVGITRKGRGDESWSRRAIRLFHTGHVLSNDFVHRGRQGRMPSTVSLRRVVQGLVDVLEHEQDLLIALAHQGGSEEGLSGHMLRSSVLAAAVARAAGLPQRLAGRAALVVFMSRFPLARLGERWQTAGSDVLSTTFDLSLKEVMASAGTGRVSAWRLVLLYEALKASLGDRAPYGNQLVTSFEGRIVEVATTYDRLRAGLMSSSAKAKPMAPAIALRRLAAMTVQQNSTSQTTLDAGLVEVLRKLMGDVPPGSLVRTQRGIFGVVRDRPGIVEVASADGHTRNSFRKKDATRVLPLDIPPDYDMSAALGWGSEAEEEEIDFSFD
ncbi:MAG: hypothetical protein ACPGU1_12155 [Myxococcota bacterium]